MEYVLIVISLILSGCFSGSEIALNTVNRVRLENQVETKGDKKSALVLKLYSEYDKTLSGILIGNNLVNIMSSSVSTMIFLSIFTALGIAGASELAATVSTVVMTVIILIFGEIIPKLLAKQHAEGVAKALSYPLWVLCIVLSPIIFLVLGLLKVLSKLWTTDEEPAPSVTEDELVSIIEQAEEEQVIDEEASEMLQSAIEFGDSTLNEILVPRIRMVTIDVDWPMERILAAATESHYSRIPVYRNNTDNIIGILNLNRFFREVADGTLDSIEGILREPIFYHKAMKLPTALNDMRRTHTHIAIVIDEFGGTLGLVTMEDILEEIVGEIWDESDDIKNDITPIDEHTYDVSADMNVYDFFDTFDLDESELESEYTTVGGWCIEKLEGVVSEADHFEYEHLYIIVSKMDDMRIISLTVIENEKQEEE